MEKRGLFTIEDFFLTSNRLYGIFGMRAPIGPPRKIPFSMRLVQIIFFVVGLAVCIQCFTFCVLTLGDKEGFLMVTHDISCIGFATLTFMKFYVMFSLKKDELVDVLNRLDALFPKTNYEQEKYEVKKYVRTHRLQDFAYTWPMFGTFFLFNISGLLFPIIRYFIIDGVYIRRLQYYYIFPAGITGEEPGVFEVYYIFGSAGSFGIVFLLLAIDLMYCSIMAVLCLEFDILNHKFRTFNPKFTQTDIRILVQEHYELLDITDKLDEVFAVCMLYNFAGSVFVICLTAFQATVCSKV